MNASIAIKRKPSRDTKRNRDWHIQRKQDRKTKQVTQTFWIKKGK